MNILFVHGFQKEWKERDLRILEEFILSGEDRFYISDYSSGKPTTENLRKYVEEVKKDVITHSPDVIIAHSMGGLIARWGIEQEGWKGIKKLIMLETPHQGIPNNQLVKKVLSKWFPEKWESVKDMTEGSEFLERLNERKERKERKEDTSYYNIVGSKLFHFAPNVFKCSDAKEIKVSSTSHQGMYNNFPVIGKIWRALIE